MSLVLEKGDVGFGDFYIKEFAEKYDFSHVTSSPRYPQSNGAAERMVKTVKELLMACRLSIVVPVCLQRDCSRRRTISQR